MSFRLHPIYLFCFLWLPNLVVGQLDQVEFARSFIASGKYEKALKKLNKINDQYGSNTELALLLAETNLKLRNYESAESWYLKAVKNPSIHPDQILAYCDLLRFNGKEDEAKVFVQKFVEYDEIVSTYWERLNSFSPSNNNDISVHPLSELNTMFDDEVIGPYQSDMLIRQSQQSKANRQGKFELFQTKINTNYTINRFPTKHKPFLRAYHAGRVDFSENGIIAVAGLEQNNRKKSKWNTLLFAYKDERGNYSNWESLLQEQGEYHNVDPSLSEDGTTVFFSSNRSGGYGGYDLYETNFIDGKWEQPVNLGPKVNTKADERYPYFHQDVYLYFSSNDMGYGGYDIYKVNLMKNVLKKDLLSAPINSHKDDLAYVALNNGNAFFSSNRGENDGRFDIYGVMGIETDKISQFVIQLRDDDGGVVSRANVSITSLSDGVEHLYNSDLRGQISHLVVGGKEIYIKISHPDFKRIEKSIDIELSSNPRVVELIPNVRRQKENSESVIEGLSYKIQIGAFSQLEKLNEKKLENVGKVSLEPLQNGVTRILVGEYRDIETAQRSLVQLQNMGYKDAYIQKYQDGERIK